MMTGEYSSGAIRATLAAIPNRPLVLAAKAAVFGAVALAVGEAAAFIAFFAGEAALPAAVPGPALGQPGVLRAVVLAGAGFCLIGLIGLGLGAIIRHTPAAIAVLVGGVYVLAQLVAAALTQSVIAYLPIAIVANSLTATKPVAQGEFHFLSPWTGLGMLCLYAVFHVATFAGTFLTFAIGAATVLLAPWLTRAVVAADRRLIRGLLGPGALAERVRALEETRALAVDDSAAMLRRLERDLHDGTQARLVALAMSLGMASEKLGDSAQPPDAARARELVESAHQTATEAIAELRDLARGIHPPVLDGGLADALATLAARSAVPVELSVDVLVRPTAAIETIAYFCAAELLANVIRHSGARHAAIEATQRDGALRHRVTDDGRGEARPGVGSGLVGLAQRVRTVDGSLAIVSPRGGPTVITVELPLHA